MKEFTRHLGPVTGVAAVPGRPLVVSGAYDGAVALFDLSTRKAELLGYHRHLVNHVAVNPEGTRAASSSSDYEVYIWNLETRALERVLRGHSDDVDCFTFASHNRGVSSGQDKRVIVWDLETGAILKIIHEHEKDVISVVFHDGMIFSSGDDMTVRQWDIETGDLVQKWGPFEHEMDTCAVDHVHRRLIVGCDDGTIRVFDIATGESVGVIEAHASGIKKVATSPITGDILSAAYDQRIRIWNASDLSEIAEVKSLPTVWERSLSWSPDGTRALGGTFDGTVVVWDAATGERLLEAGTAGGPVGHPAGNQCFNEISASPAGDAAVVSDDGLVRMVHISPGDVRLLSETAPRSGPVLMNAVTLDSASGLVVSGGHDHRLRIFRRTGDTLTETAAVRLGEGPINCIRIAGQDIFAACYSGAIVRLSPDGAIQRRIYFHDGAVKALRLHPDRPLGISCSADGAIFSWTFDGEIVERYPGHISIADDVDLDPSGRLIASVSRDFTTRVFDLNSGRLLHSVAIGHRSPKSVCFWDENTVLIGDYWGALIKVHLATGRKSKNQIGRNGFSSLARTDAGVLASSYDGGIYLIRPADLTVLAEYRAMTQRLREAAA